MSDEVNSHPEDFCQLCNRPNAVWFAPNDLWNKAVREQGLPEILCPVCFIQTAERSQAFTAVWEVAPQGWHVESRTSPYARVHQVDDARVAEIRERAEVDGYRKLTLRDGNTTLALVQARADVLTLLQLSSSEREQIHKVLTDELLGTLTPREAVGAIQRITKWEPPSGVDTIELRSGASSERRCVKCERRERELLAAALGVIEQSIRPSVVTEGELRLPKYLARLKHAILAYPPVPVAEGEPQRVYCPGCSEAGDADRAVYHTPPICAPTAAPVVEARIPSDFITATGELKDWNASTVTPSEAARERAKDLLREWRCSSISIAAFHKNGQRKMAGDVDRYLVNSIAAAISNFPPTEATKGKGNALLLDNDDPNSGSVSQGNETTQPVVGTIRQGNELNGKPLEVILGQLGSPASRQDVERFRCLIEDLRRDATAGALKALKQKEPSQ